MTFYIWLRASVRLREILLASTLMLLARQPALADCSPQAASNVTATCTGTTVNQGGGAPGTSGATNGYGTGAESGITVNVAAGAANTVSGTAGGIAIADGTVTNNAGASITGGTNGVVSTGAVNVTNSGSIAGTSGIGIFATTNATVTNNAGASITGGTGIDSNGVANVTNYGNITGSYGIYAASNATVTNSAGASITGSAYGVYGSAAVNVTNSGSITGNSQFGIYAFSNATVTNNAGASITSAAYGILGMGAVNVTNSGSITGTSQYGIYAATGGSSVFNAGSIVGSTAIQFSGTGNTLTLAPGSVISGNVLGAGSDTFQLGGVGAASFDVSQLGAAAQYRGFGTFNKIGSSTWTLTGTGTFAGPVNVNGGTLEVDGSIASSSGVVVRSGGMLTGTGSVAATQINSGGTLMPGSTANPTGMLTISGNLALASGAMYIVMLNPSTANFASVTGTATLGGATVNAVFASGSYVAKQYTILTAASGVSGTFASGVVNTNLPANFHTALSYDSTHAYLDLILSFAIPGGINANQQGVGNALTNFFNGNGSLPIVYSQLSAAGLSQAAGEPATGSQQTTFDAMGQFMGLLTDPFPGRGNGIDGSPPATGYADESASAYAASRNPTDALAMFTKAPQASLYQPHWSVWASSFGGSQSTSGNAVVGSNDATSRIVGTAVGADYLFAPNTLVGFALAGGGTSFSVNGLGSGRSDLFQAGAYMRHTNGAAYITGALAYGWQDITTNRSVTIAGLDQLRAEFNANAYSGRMEGGYRFVAPLAGGVGLTPYVAGQFTTFDLPGYAEQVVSGANAFALAYGSKSVTDTRSELGLRADKSFAMSNGILTLRSRLAWAHDFDPDRSVAATFQALPGASFVVNGAAQAPDSALTTASAEIRWMNGWSAAATFEGEFSNVTQSYAGKGVVRYAW